MANKYILGVLGAGLVLSLAAPALAQNDRGRGDGQRNAQTTERSGDRANSNRANNNQAANNRANNNRSNNNRTATTNVRVVVANDLNHLDVDYRASDSRQRSNRARDNDRRSDNYRSNNTRTKRQTFPTRYRANIVLTETATRTRRGVSRVCTVAAQGPQARYVPKKRLRNIARDNCSRVATVRILA